VSLFPAYCKAAGLPVPVAELRFAPPRRWRLTRRLFACIYSDIWQRQENINTSFASGAKEHTSNGEATSVFARVDATHFIGENKNALNCGRSVKCAVQPLFIQISRSSVQSNVGWNTTAEKGRNSAVVDRVKDGRMGKSLLTEKHANYAALYFMHLHHCSDVEVESIAQTSARSLS
jgi:hypothetical protein